MNTQDPRTHAGVSARATKILPMMLRLNGWSAITNHGTGLTTLAKLGRKKEKCWIRRESAGGGLSRRCRRVARVANVRMPARTDGPRLSSRSSPMS